MPRICQKTKKRANNSYTVSHSHKRTKRLQNVNLQKKKIWCIQAGKYKKLLVSTKGIKTLLKKK
uniref:Large ribosomal subunit protein bL28c n=1 Tax=Apophlaea sinclairii TaxID=212746 RepID=A0A1C9CBH9_9FLOR|nr:ribosomal protein L28 [Apophlaea sinclairii]AOM65741.1 ribosomal protein L28 [Apophlaea sinclairii]